MMHQCDYCCWYNERYGNCDCPYVIWYNENTPSEDEEYEKGCLSIALIVVIIFIALTVVILSYEL